MRIVYVIENQCNKRGNHAIDLPKYIHTRLHENSNFVFLTVH